MPQPYSISSGHLVGDLELPLPCKLIHPNGENAIEYCNVWGKALGHLPSNTCLLRNQGSQNII